MRRASILRLWLRFAFFILPALPLAAQVNFLTALSFPTGQGPRNVAAGDLNGDGKVDLVTCNSGDNTISVLLGNGDGTFRPAVAYSVGVAPDDLALGDFNGDGKLDVVVSSAGTVKAVYVLLGNGDGTFQPAVSYPTTDVPVGVAVGDFNGDGKLDIATTDSSAGVDILLGNGDGTFKVPLHFSTQPSPGYLAVGDFNGDGKLDLAVTNSNGPTGTYLSIYLGNGDGTFTAGASYQFYSNLFRIAAADVNLDGKLDIVVPDGGTVVMLGNGDGTFAASGWNAPIGGMPAVADFNGDGKPDLAISDSSNLVHIFPGNGDGTFQNSIDYVGGTGPMVAADLNGDSKADLASVGYGSGIGILLGNGDGSFRAARSFPFGSVASGIYGANPSLVLDDLNGDGKLDYASGVNGVLVGLGNGDGTFQAPKSLGAGGTGGTGEGIVAADFNNDGFLDLSAVTQNFPGSAYNQQVAVLLGNGNGTFQAEKDFTAPASGFVAAARFTGSGNIDLVLGGNYEGVALGDGTGTFSPQVPFVTQPSRFPPVTGDFNEDGKADYVYLDGNTLEVFLGNGDGTFQQSLTSYSFSPAGLAAADLNGDGTLDIVVAENPSGAGDVSILLGNGDGTFKTPVKYGIGNSAGAVAIADVNHDGYPDLVVAATSELDVLLGNGDGTFQPAINVGALPGSNGGLTLAVGDVNGDGLPDVLVEPIYSPPGHFMTGGVVVFLNQTGVVLGKSSVALASSLNPAASGQSVTFTATVTALGGSGSPTGTVTFLIGSTAMGTATLSGSSATWTTTTLGVGNDNITASYSGDKFFSGASSSPPLVQVVNAQPFTAAPSGNSSATINAGQAAQFTLSLTSMTAQSQTVTLTCTQMPPLSTCTVSPSSVPLGGTASASPTVTVQTAGNVASLIVPGLPAATRATPSPNWMFAGFGLALFGIRRRKVRYKIASGCLLLAATLLFPACGGGSSGPKGTPPATYTVTVSAASGSSSSSVNFTLTVQ